MDLTATSLDAIPIGSVVQIVAHDKRLQYMTLLIGIDTNKMVITEIPTLDKLNKQGMRYEDIYFVGRDLTMKTLAAGKIYSFDTQVMGVYIEKSRMLFCSFPQSVRCRSLRREARYPCTLPCDMIFGGAKTDGVMTNISQGGCQIRVQNLEHTDTFKKMQKEEDWAMLEVFFPFMETPANLGVTIKSIAREDRAITLGAAFNGDPDAFVRAYLDSLHLESLNSYFS